MHCFPKVGNSGILENQQFLLLELESQWWWKTMGIWTSVPGAEKNTDEKSEAQSKLPSEYPPISSPHSN